MSGDNDKTAPVVGRAAAADTAPISPPPSVTYVGRASLPPVPTQVWTDEDYYAYGQPPVIVEPRPHRSFTRLAWITAGIVALFCLIGGATVVATKALLDRPGTSTGAAGASANPAPAPAKAPKPAPAPAAPGLNDPVRDGMFQFTVTDVSCGHRVVQAGLFERTAQGQYCLVTLTVANVGSQGRGFAEDFQKAIDRDQASYTPDVAAGLIVNGNASAVFSTVHPGAMVSGTMVFDIPRGGSIAKLELHDSPFSNGATITL